MALLQFSLCEPPQAGCWCADGTSHHSKTVRAVVQKVILHIPQVKLQRMQYGMLGHKRNKKNLLTSIRYLSNMPKQPQLEVYG